MKTESKTNPNKKHTMQKPPAPAVLTTDNPIAAFESAIPLLLEILPIYCGSSDLVREIVWSVYNGHPVSLNRLHILDQDRKDAVLAVINLRMDPYSRSGDLLEKLLEESGEFKRREQTLELAKEHGFFYTNKDYPLSDDQTSALMERVNRANDE